MGTASTYYCYVANEKLQGAPPQCASTTTVTETYTTTTSNTTTTTETTVTSSTTGTSTRTTTTTTSSITTTTAVAPVTSITVGSTVIMPTASASATSSSTTAAPRSTTTQTDNRGPALRCEDVVSGTTAGKASRIGNPAGEVWHEFCPNESLAVAFSSCGSSFDTWLRLLQGDTLTEVAECDDCGPCESRAVLGLPLSAGLCYELVIEGFGRQEGEYSLAVVCCSRRSSCCGRGQPYTAYSLNAGVRCACACDPPFGGATCDRCENSTHVLVNGTCQPCFSHGPSSYVALTGSTFVWPVDFSVSPCFDAVPLSSYGTMRSTAATMHHTASVRGDAGVSMPNCMPNDEANKGSLLLIAAGTQYRGTVQCVADLSCGVGAPRVHAAHVHLLECSDLTISVALGLATLLFDSAGGTGSTLNLTTFHGNQFTAVHRGGSFSEFVTEVQSMLNSLASPSARCTSSARNGFSLELAEIRTLQRIADSTSGLLVLLGDLPPAIQIAEALKVLAARQIKILWLGRHVTAPRFVTSVLIGSSPPGLSWQPEVCVFLGSLRQVASGGDCKPTSLVFAPASVPALQRARIRVVGVCHGEWCCVGARCQRLVASKPGQIVCYLPLFTTLGPVDFSVILANGSSVRASQPLVVVAAASALAVRRPARPSSSGFLAEYENHITVQFSGGTAPSPACCQYVGIGFYDLSIVDNLSAPVCLGASAGTGWALPLPTPLEWNPFAQPLGMVAVRCYRPSLLDLPDDGGSSIMLDNGESAAPPEAADRSWWPPWRSIVPQSRAERYMKYALDHAGTEPRGRALGAVRAALQEGAGLRSRSLPEERDCGGEAIPDLTGTCYWTWCSTAQDAGPHLESAGFESHPTDWQLSDALLGDVVVIPGFSAWDPADGQPISFPSGDIAIFHGTDSAAPWVSDRKHGFRRLSRLQNVSSQGRIPVLYRLSENIEVPHEEDEHFVPVPVIQDLLPASLSAQYLYMAARVDGEDVLLPLAAEILQKHYRCPAFWDARIAMPAQLRPSVGGFRSAGPRCLEMPPALDREVGVRCCYGQSGTFLKEWPSRLLLGRPGTWRRAEEDARERLERKVWAAAGRRLGPSSTAQRRLQAHAGSHTAGGLAPLPPQGSATTQPKAAVPDRIEAEVVTSAHRWENRRLDPDSRKRTCCRLEGVCPDGPPCKHCAYYDNCLGCATEPCSRKCAEGETKPCNKLEKEWGTLTLGFGQTNPMIFQDPKKGDKTTKEEMESKTITEKEANEQLLSDINKERMPAAAKVPHWEDAPPAVQSAVIDLLIQFGPCTFKEAGNKNGPFCRDANNPLGRAMAKLLQNLKDKDYNAFAMSLMGLNCIMREGKCIPNPNMEARRAYHSCAIRRAMGESGGECSEPGSCDYMRNQNGAVVKRPGGKSCDALLQQDEDRAKIYICQPSGACDGGPGGPPPRPPPPPTNQPFGPTQQWERQRAPAGGWGDPHCSTYDGLNFECNFKGEALWTQCGHWRVHAVADVVRTGTATSIRSVAVRHLDDTVVVTLANTTQVLGAQGFVVTLNGKQHRTAGDYLLSMVEGSTILVVDAVGNMVEVAVLPEQLALSVRPKESCFNRTVGLMGNNNGDMLDDLQPFVQFDRLDPTKPAGNSTEALSESIYSLFVLSWGIIRLEDSLFPIQQFQPCDLMFRPAFGSEMRGACAESCQGVRSCCFDAQVVGESFAVASTTFTAALQESREVACKFGATRPSFVTAPEYVQVSSRRSEDPQLLARFVADGGGQPVVALTCSVCPGPGAEASREPDLSCEVTGTGTPTASLLVVGRGLPLGTFSCEAVDGAGTVAVAVTEVHERPDATMTTTTPEDLAVPTDGASSPSSAGVCTRDCPLIVSLVAAACCVVAAGLTIYCWRRRRQRQQERRHVLPVSDRGGKPKLADAARQPAAQQPVATILAASQGQDVLSLAESEEPMTGAASFSSCLEI